MTGEVWQFAGSLAAVAAMVALAWRMGFSGTPVLADERQARSVADGLPGGFDATAVAIDAAGHGALLRDARGRIVAVVPHGAHFVARAVEPGAMASQAGGSITIVARRWTLGLDLGESRATDWAAAINRLT